MKSTQHRIYSLDTISQSQIQSSIHITSLNEVIVELVKNALDANAGSIHVLLNYGTGFCSVQDDGTGIAVQNFAPEGRLAERYCTSKLNRSSNLYGRYGRFLAAVSGVALLSISSRCEDERVHTLWVNETGRLSHGVEEERDWHALRGTRVKVYNLFSKFPVRRKHLASHFTSKSEVGKEFDQLKYKLTGLMLAFPGTFNLDVSHTNLSLRFGQKHGHRNVELNKKERTLRDLDVGCWVLHQFGYTDHAQATRWQCAHVRSEDIEIQAAFSLDPSPHKLVQFISIDQDPLSKQTHPALFETVNATFDLSTFGSLEPNPQFASYLTADDEVRPLQLNHASGRRKGVDRWPMFIIWITKQHGGADVPYDGDSEDFGKIVQRCSVLLRTVITEFLMGRGFSFPTKSKQQVQDTLRTSVQGDLSLATRQSYSLPDTDDVPCVMSGSRFALGDALSGLPFRESKNNQRQVPSASTDTQRIDDSTAFEHSHRLQSQSSSTSSDDLTWTDPQTGHITRLDPRTGISLPETRQSTIHNEGLACCEKRQSPITFSQLAQNARKYLGGLTNSGDKPVRTTNYSNSLILGPDDGRLRKNRHARRFGQSSEMATFRDDNFALPKLSRAALANLTVLGQVDKKFILGVVAPCTISTSSNKTISPHQLVLVDQHAADERVKIEQLIRSFYDNIVTLNTPIRFQTSEREADMLQRHKPYFERLHILYKVQGGRGISTVEHAAQVSTSQVHITALPEVIAERCRLQPKIIIDLLREEIWSDDGNPSFQRAGRANVSEHHDAGNNSYSGCRDISIASTWPLRLLELLNSRACRSAIMFNDELTHAQCASLVRSLAKCTLPFQCAHGRPSVVALADLHSFPKYDPLIGNEIGLHSLGLAALGTPSAAWWHKDLNVIDDARSFESAYKDWV